LLLNALHLDSSRFVFVISITGYKLPLILLQSLRSSLPSHFSYTFRHGLDLFHFPHLRSRSKGGVDKFIAVLSNRQSSGVPFLYYPSFIISLLIQSVDSNLCLHISRHTSRFTRMIFFAVTRYSISIIFNLQFTLLYNPLFQ
jgi:hypothetical protein